MYPEPAVRQPPAARQFYPLHDDELLYLVPPTGIDCGALDVCRARHNVHARCERRHQRERASGPIPAASLAGPLQRSFEVHAQVNPGARALKFDGVELTYGELDSQADGLAVLLQQNGLEPGQLCALYMEPSLALVRAILAVLKAGGAYLLLDPAQPEQSRAAILDIARPRLLLTQERLALRLNATPAPTLLCSEDPSDLPYAWPQEWPSPGMSAACATASVSVSGHYCVVPRTQTAMLAHLGWLQEISPIGQGDSILQNTGPGLNGSEIMWSLSHGARLVIPSPRDAAEPARVRQLVARERITVMHVASSQLRPLLNGAGAGELRSLRALLCPGRD